MDQVVALTPPGKYWSRLLHPTLPKRSRLWFEEVWIIFTIDGHDEVSGKALGLGLPLDICTMIMAHLKTTAPKGSRYVLGNVCPAW